MKTKILVIDDDPGIRRGLALILKAEGYRVTEAENGRAGLDLASDESPDLVLCDVSMPEMDGYEVVERLRRIPALASTPFIFLTARDERADVRKGMEIVVGHEGVRIAPLQRSTSGTDIFQFLNTRLSAERPKTAVIREIALAFEKARKAAGKILLVAGASVVQTGAAEYLEQLIKWGYVQLLVAAKLSHFAGEPNDTP